eukprot:3936717-Rhodomonas_salina.3
MAGLVSSPRAAIAPSAPVLGPSGAVSATEVSISNVQHHSASHGRPAPGKQCCSKRPAARQHRTPRGARRQAFEAVSCQGPSR